MAANRIAHYSTAATSTARRQKPAGASIPPGFVVCPPTLVVANSWQQEIYRLAYERAQAAAAIPRHHRMLFCVWN